MPDSSDAKPVAPPSNLASLRARLRNHARDVSQVETRVQRRLAALVVNDDLPRHRSRHRRQHDDPAHHFGAGGDAGGAVRHRVGRLQGLAGGGRAAQAFLTGYRAGLILAAVLVTFGGVAAWLALRPSAQPDDVVELEELALAG